MQPKGLLSISRHRSVLLFSQNTWWIHLPSLFSDPAGVASNYPWLGQKESLPPLPMTMRQFHWRRPKRFPLSTKYFCFQAALQGDYLEIVLIPSCSILVLLYEGGEDCSKRRQLHDGVSLAQFLDCSRLCPNWGRKGSVVLATRLSNENNVIIRQKLTRRQFRVKGLNL